MDLSLHGHQALVCGSSQGIGRATAEALAALGARCTLVARNEKKLAEARDALPAVESGPHRILAIDLDETAALKTALGTLVADEGAHTIAVLNAGGPPAGPVFSAEPEEFLTAIRRHVVANQVIAQALVPGMRDARYGRIVNIVSTSVYEPIPNLGVSNTTRGAVASWAKTLSKELGPDGITVNCVLPGFTDTERLGSLIAGRAEREGRSEDQVAAAMRSMIPAGRFAAPHEIAEVIAFLASPVAGYVNGVALAVDGGRLASI